MFNKSKTIILVALEDELPKKYLPTWNIIYSGVGKVNAAYSLSKAIHEFEPSTVINFGTAGTLNSNLNGLHEVSVFKQRDMNAVGLGFVLGETPALARLLPKHYLTLTLIWFGIKNAFSYRYCQAR